MNVKKGPFSSLRVHKVEKRFLSIRVESKLEQAAKKAVQEAL